MFVIWGWNFKTKKHYGDKNVGCLACNNGSVSYTRVISWFTLFFIPIIPYSFSYIKHCDICGQQQEIGKSQFFEELNGIATPLGFPQTALGQPSEIVPSTWSSRDITVVMKKIKNIVKVDYYIDGGLVSSGKNGESRTFAIDDLRHDLSAVAEVNGLGEIKSESMAVMPGYLNKKYRLILNTDSGTPVLILIPS